ncbi:hypothetical protein D3C73_807040 [compost metagenome]
MLADRDLRRRGCVLAHVAGLLQQFVQGFQQHALLAGIGFTGRALFATRMLLHVATTLRPARGKSLRPGRCGLFVVIELVVEARCRALLDQIIQAMRNVLRRGRRQWSARGTHLRHHPGRGQVLVQLFVDAAHRRAQVALAQLDQHQMHFRGQLTAGEGFVNGHAQMLGADRVAVGIEVDTAAQPAQSTVEPRQHRLEVAQQHGGEVAHRQPRFQYMFRHQAQAILGWSGQGQLGRDGLARSQASPGMAEMAGKRAGNVLTAAAQLAHRVQEQQLRRAGIAGTVEQGIIEAGQCRAKGLAQRRQDDVPGKLELGRVTARRSHRSGRAHHSGRLPTFSGATDIMDITTAGTPHAPVPRW